MSDERNIEDVVAEHLNGIVLPIPAMGAVLTALRELRELRVLRQAVEGHAAAQAQYASPRPNPPTATDSAFAPAFAGVLQVLEFGAGKHGYEWVTRDDEEDLKHAMAHIIDLAMACDPLDSETRLPHIAHAIARLVLIFQRGINQSS